MIGAALSAIAREAAAHEVRREAARLAELVARHGAGEVLRGLKGTSVVLDLSDLARVRKGAKKAVIVGSNRAAKPVRLAMIASAQRIARYGFTARAVGSKARVYPSDNVISVVGPKMSFARNKGRYARGPRKGQPRRHIPYLYSWLLEKGTKRSRPRQYIGPAFDAAGREYPTRAAAAIAAELAGLLG